MKKSIYKETETLENKIFKNPPSEYRGTPFWAWNGDLKEEYLLEQIEAFKKMGLGGAHMHVRTGLTIEYLGKDFMDRIKLCTEKFKKEKMLSWLYDEDRWPSGAAGGIVTKNKDFRLKHLLLSRSKRPENEYNTLLACYDIVLDENDYIDHYERIGENDTARGMKWYAYQYVSPGGDNWFNGQSYLDTLSKKAVGKFIEVTHEAYAKNVGKEFGKTIPAIFTDEPNWSYKENVIFSRGEKNVRFPWTYGFAEEYKKRYGCDLLDYLPEIFWEQKDGKLSPHRYYINDLATELFVTAFSDQVGKWCEKHDLLFTGHMLHEGTLEMQTICVGDCMRSYRGFGLPGIDMLCNYHEYVTAKQCQSAVHQYDRCGMLSELYGVTNWDHDFRGHKHQGDWQAALGVTTRVHHLAYYSMEGEAKRDYPASIGYQSPWYEEYKYIEDHFARVNTAMTRGKADVKVGVIHPIETYWLHRGPTDKTSDICAQIENNFQSLAKWLLFGTVDFDYICEGLLPELCKKPSNPLKVGAMKYDVIIVPACETLRSTTLERLEAFKENGGRVIFMGDSPRYCDALPSERGKKLYDKCEVIGFGKTEILSALEDVRDVSIIASNGKSNDNLIYQMRKEKNGTKWLFIANGVDYKDIDFPTHQDVKITIKGKFTPTYYDTLTGEISKIPFSIVNGNTVIDRRVFNHDSLLYRLDKYKKGDEVTAKQKEYAVTQVRFPSKVDFSLSEKNVLVLDMAEYKLNDGDWHDEEEMLRLDTECRKMLGFPMMSGRSVQPWMVEEEKTENFVTLRFNIDSETEVAAPTLAVERTEAVKITLNGKSVPSERNGYYVDRYIGTVALPPIKKGRNVLELVCPIGRRITVENAFITGDFGVCVTGREKTITALPEKLSFDDIRHQGLAFYGANITYKCEVETKENGILSLHAPVYRGAVISVKVDGKDEGYMAFSPYTLDIKGIKAGKHTVELTLYGTRMNTFGQLHCHHHLSFDWYGPASFRTAGDEWAYEYETKPAGILRTPTACTKK